MILIPPEGTWLAAFDKRKLVWLWEKFAPYDALWADDKMRDPEVFMRRFLDPSTVCLETDGGVMLLERILEGVRAEVHFMFWDHKLSARTELLKECLLWAFLSFGLERVETFVADYARAVRRFVEEKMGFTYEGTLRHRVKHQGRFIDMKVYGILKDEVL